MQEELNFRIQTFVMDKTHMTNMTVLYNIYKPFRISHAKLMYDIFPNSRSSCGCKGHYWNSRELMFQYIQLFVVGTEVMSPL